MNEPIYNLSLIPNGARGSKEARSETAEIRMAAGQVYFPHGAPFLWDLEQELIHFPKAEYADQVDALAHAARLVQHRGGPPVKGDADLCVPNSDGNPTEDDDEWP